MEMREKLNILKQDFYTRFTDSYSGDSGIGGNDPQDPDCQFNCYPDDVWNWVKDNLCQSAVKEAGVISVPSIEEIAQLLVNNAHGCKDINNHHGKIENTTLIHSGCVMCWAEYIHALLTNSGDMMDETEINWDAVNYTRDNDPHEGNKD